MNDARVCKKHIFLLEVELEDELDVEKEDELEVELKVEQELE